MRCEGGQVVCRIPSKVILCAGLCPECTIVPVDPPALHRWWRRRKAVFCSRFPVLTHCTNRSCCLLWYWERIAQYHSMRECSSSCWLGWVPVLRRKSDIPSTVREVSVVIYKRHWHHIEESIRGNCLSIKAETYHQISGKVRVVVWMIQYLRERLFRFLHHKKKRIFLNQTGLLYEFESDHGWCLVWVK